MTDKLLTVVKEALEIEDRDLNLTDDFKAYDEWDSLARLSLIAELDSEFDVQIESDSFDSLTTIEDLLKVITEKKSA